MSFHKLAKAKDKRFWSVRVGTDLRLIVHRTADSLLLCYVDHHDKAYAWAERRKLETHPATGAAQLVEIRERVQEIVVPTYVQAPPTPAPKKPLLAHVPDERAARLRRAGRVAGRRARGHRGHGAHAGGPPAGRGCRGGARAGNRGHAVQATACTRGSRPIRSPRRVPALPRVHRRRRAGARAGVSVGAMDGVPAPGAARIGGAPLWRAGPHRRLGRYGEDHRRAPPCSATWPAPIPTRASCSPPSRRRWRARCAPSSCASSAPSRASASASTWTRWTRSPAGSTTACSAARRSCRAK